MIDIDLMIIDSRHGNEWPMPGPATPMSAGTDLRTTVDLVLEPGEAKLVPTGIAMHINSWSHAGFIYPRSGLGHKEGLVLGNGTGVIDADYTGEIKVSLWNRGTGPAPVSAGDRIAQLVIQRIQTPHFNVVSTFGETTRAAGGFGSTGSR